MLNIVVDNSGSLIEGGKRFIERTLLRQLREMWFAKNPPEALRLFLLKSTGLNEVTWSADEDVPNAVLSPRGRTSIDDLIAHPWTKDDGVVFLCDYCMLPEERKALRVWVSEMGIRRARLLIVGDGLSVDQTEQGLYTAEQIDGVLTEFLTEDTENAR